MILSIIYFFVVMLGLGYSITSIFNISFRDTYEYIFMTLGIGLGTFTVLASIFSIVNIPLHWATFLIIAIIGLVIGLYKKHGFTKKVVE